MKILRTHKSRMEREALQIVNRLNHATDAELFGTLTNWNMTLSRSLPGYRYIDDPGGEVTLDFSLRIRFHE